MTPRLVAVSDQSVAGATATLERFGEIARLARPASVAFQLRDPELGARERLDFGRALVALARDAGQLVLVNDRLDLALLLGADGVHLGESGVETADARRLLGEGALVFRACHDPVAARTVDADAVLLSPVLEPRKGRPALGLEAIGRARAAAAGRAVAIFALGGVDAARARECLSAGAEGVAVVGALLGRVQGPALVRALGIAR